MVTVHEVYTLTVNRVDLTQQAIKAIMMDDASSKI